MDQVTQTAAPLPLSAIKPKMRFEGTIIKTRLEGAVVDIGAEKPAVLHISQMRTADKPHINRVTEIANVGDKVTVWVKEVDVPQGLIILTMIEPPLYDWSDLKKDLKVTGKVTRVTDFGAFVDFKGPREGLVPAGQLARQRINKPSDVVAEGDEVTAWVVSVERKRERIGLTLIEPPALPWEQLKKGHTYRGKVTRLERFGAFVDIGAEREGLVHVSELAPGYVGDPADFVQVGEEVQVKVLDVDRRKRQIQLSMKELVAQEAQTAEPAEELPTPMEQAFQSARQPKAAPPAQPPAARKDDRQRQLQKDILRRTLEQHQANR